MKLRDYTPALKFGAKIYPEDLATENPWASYWYVDEDNGSDSANNGSASDKAVASLEQAIANAGRNDVIFVRAQAMATGATDPESYTENAIITADKDLLSIVGVPTGRVQGGLPQLKVGSTTTQAIITVRAPGCRIANIGINGAGATGGGILLDDDGSTKTAFGTTVENCHFKNCKGTTATNAATGGAIQIGSSGGAWQSRFVGNRFYKNVGDVVVLGTSAAVPQDIVIEDNVFSGPAANVDCNIYTGGSGVDGIIVRNNLFTAMPALSSGTNVRYLNLTGSVGLLADCYFASIVSPTGSEGTFAAAGSLAKVPATVFIAGCYGETTTTGETGEIFRT